MGRAEAPEMRFVKMANRVSPTAMLDVDNSNQPADPDACAKLKETCRSMKAKQLCDSLQALIREEDALETNKNPTIRDMARAKAVLAEAADDLHTAVQHFESGSDSDDLPHSIAKQARQLMYGMAYDALLEMFNEGGDVSFLILNLRGDEMADLFWASLSALMLSLLMRVVFCCRVRDRVDWSTSKKWRWWWYGTAMSLIEPNMGNRMLKKSFKNKDKSGGETWDPAQQKYVDNLDPKAVRAANNLRNVRLEMRTSLTLVLVEDVPELVIEILYLARSGSEATSPLFIITALGTALHMIRQLKEAWALRKTMVKLQKTAECRDKAFKDSEDLNEKVLSFAKRAGLELRRLNLSYCGNLTAETVIAIAQYCPNLTTISLHGCDEITDESVKALAAKCPNFTTIHLNNCDEITDESVKALAAKCPNLTTIDLSGCDKITDESAKALAANCPNLTSIYLYECDITDESVKALAAKCPKLTTMDLYGCAKITDESVKALAAKCPNLTSIYLYECHITDESVEALTAKCPNLTTIYLNGCAKITDESVKALAAKCPNLMTINLTLCPKITDESVKALKAALPNVKVRGR